MAGGFSVLKDVGKMLVYRLARYRNTLGYVIPERIITRAPSAELRPDQTDQDNLPPYDVLDAIVKVANQAILENATNLVLSINVWNYDKQATNFILTPTSSPTNLVNLAVTATNVNMTSGTNASGMPPCCARNTRNASLKRASVNTAPSVTTHQ